MSALATGLQTALQKHQAGAYEEAEALYLAILEADPDTAPALNLLGVLCGQTGRIEAAEQYLRDAVRAAPDDGGAHYNLGNVLRERGLLDEAATQFEQTIRLAPAHASARFNLGATRLEQGRAEEAIDEFRRTVEIDPGHARAHHHLALLLLADGEPDTAAEHWQRALEHAPDEVEYRLNLGLARHRAGRFDEAVEQFRMVTRAAPDLAGGWCNLGAALRAAGRPDEAVTASERALELDPALGAAHANLSLARSDQGQPSATAAAVEDALRQNGLLREERSRLCFLLGTARDALGDEERAFRAFEEANRLSDVEFDCSAAHESAGAVIEVFSSERMATLPRVSAAALRPIFVTGLPCCGRSSLTRLLAAHEGVAAAGEIGLLGGLVDRIAPLTGVQTPFPDCMGQFDAEAIDRLAQWAGRELGRHAGDAGRVIESSSTSFVVLGLLPLLFPDARVVVCRRDPLDACLACYFRPFEDGHEYAYDLEHLGSFHRMQERLLDHWACTLELPMLSIGFEEMQADPEAIAGEVAAFCDLEPARVAPDEWLDRVEPKPARRYEAFLGPLREALARP